MVNKHIPLSIPHFGGNEEKYLRKCIKDNWVSSVGPYVTQFEKEFAKKVGVKRAVACSSGTAALHLSLLAVGVKLNHLVIVSSLTFIASVNAIRYVGAEPVMVDCDSETWQMNTALVEDFLNEKCYMNGEVCIFKETGQKVSAILPVHILGHACDIKTIQRFANEYNLIIIEDASEGLGVKVDGKQVGSFGVAGCFSFNGNKTITAGSGGMVVTDLDGLADKIKSLSEQAKAPGIEYIHNDVGYNYRMTNLHAAVGLAQLEQLENFVEQKCVFAKKYEDAFSGMAGVQWIKPMVMVESAWWLFTITLDEAIVGISARNLMARLKKIAIESRPLWQPMHLSKPHKQYNSLFGNVAENLYETALSLPSSVGMTDKDQNKVIKEILNILREYKLDA